jgi:hypothetical protein
MRAAPRLSIGLPVYNGEKYLAESLDAPGSAHSAAARQLAGTTHAPLGVTRTVRASAPRTNVG